jgi:alpha-glucoside transport system substrate-binding protein
VLLAAVACSSSPSSADLSVPVEAQMQGEAQPGLRILGSWEAAEQEVLRDVLAPFEERTGYAVELVTTRDPRAVIDSGLKSGDPPDVAALPGPGYLATLARAGHLVDLSAVIDPGVYKQETAPAFVSVGTVDGKLVGAVLKGTIKGLFWFDPDVFDGEAPASWNELQLRAMSALDGVRPWCIGLESDAASGWPGTDWIEDFVLRQSGPRVYDDWVAGRLSWTAPEIRWAFQSYGTVVSEDQVAGGVSGALETNFSRAADDMFRDPPGCLLAHQGTFMASFLAEAAAAHGGRYAFMPFPPIDPEFSGALIGAGDLIALLRDSEPGRELVRYLLGKEAQALLLGHCGALSGNLTVDTYPDAILEQQAQLLKAATIFRFDASDAMPEAMGRAFSRAVLDFTADQGRLDDILAGLDAVQADFYRQAP